MRYFISFLIAIGLIVLVFILILKGVSSGGGSKVSPPKPLVSYASTSAEATLIIDGPVVYDQNHNSVQINVDQYQTQINIIQGYQGKVVNTQSFPNNQDAYATFLRAIDIGGFTNGNNLPALSDYRGVCPYGARYIYKFVNGEGKTTQNYWATSCGGQGTFKGSVTLVDGLFKAQIPNYSQLIQNVTL